MNQNCRRSTYRILLFGTAVFSMHFGGSCMLWPVTWGQQSGSSVLKAAAGIMISGIMLPFFGYLAVVRGNGSFYTLISRISDRFALIFGGFTVAVLGPLFVIPRMSAASWDAICQIAGWNSDVMLPALLFAAVYYLITYWFMFNLDEVLTKIGKVLVPLLLVTVVFVVTKSLMNPMSEWMPKLFPEGAFQYGFINGYQTMDLPCALIYGAIIVADLKAQNVTGRRLSKSTLLVGGVGFAILAASHFSQMLVGASTGYVFVNIAYAKLYATIILKLTGMVGGVVFNMALLLAALTTAVGLSAGTAAYVEEATKQKWAYRKVAVVTLAISAIVSAFGLTTIVKITAPSLSLVYPPCIVLVLGYAILGRSHIGIIGGSTMAAFAWGCIDGAMGYSQLLNINTSALTGIYNKIPLAQFGLGWTVPALAGAVIGYYMVDRKRPAPSPVRICTEESASGKTLGQ